MGLDTLLNDIARLTWHSSVTGNKLTHLFALWGFAQFPISGPTHINS